MNESTLESAAVSAERMATPSAPRSRRLLVLAVLGLLLVAGLGAGAWWFLVPASLSTSRTKADVEPAFKVTVPLGAVVVNLSGETRRYLRVGVSLGVPATSDGRAIEDHKSQLLDLLIAVLSSTDPATLASPEGKAAIKDTLLARIREELHLTKVGRVYFTEFVIQ